jgi:ribose transport system substrate-binding protein
MKTKILFLLTILALLVTACQPTPPPAPAVVVVTATPDASITAVSPVVTNRSLQKGKPFRFVHGNGNHPTMALMDLGVLDACKHFEVDCELLTGPYLDDATQIANTEQAVALGSSGLILVPYGPYLASITDASKSTFTVGIHFPVTDPSTVPGMNAWVAPDVVTYSNQAADTMCMKLNGKGVVAITQSAFNDTENLVTATFTARMTQKCPNVKILPTEEEGLDSPAAIAKASAIMIAHPEITAALSTTGGGAVTWGQALQQAGKKPGEITVLAMDYSRQNLDLVKSGWVYALIGQPIYAENYMAVKLLVDMLRGDPYLYANPLPSDMITKDNVDKFYVYADEVDKMLAPKK